VNVFSPGYSGNDTVKLSGLSLLISVCSHHTIFISQREKKCKENRGQLPSISSVVLGRDGFKIQFTVPFCRLYMKSRKHLSIKV
jgi:hypothetical protein